MSSRSTRIVKGTLAALHATRLAALGARFTKGTGVIFMPHHVRPQAPGPVAEFSPNGILSVTPEFLEQIVRYVIEAGFEIVSLDEVPERLSQTAPKRPFACFTFDDGYRDNRTYAYPILKRFGVPFTIYVPSDFADGNGDLWWLTLERAIAASTAVTFEGRQLACATAAEKSAVFETIYWSLRAMPEADARGAVAGLAAAAGVDVSRQCADLVMDWDELRALARDPLVTIGAHTKAHFAIGQLDKEAARREISSGKERLEAELGRVCRHFSFPYGCEASAGERDFELAREAGFTTAVTTRKGLLQVAHNQSLTGLPRFSLNGDYQDLRYIRVLLSGVPFALLGAAGSVKNGMRAAARAMTRLSSLARQDRVSTSTR